MQYTKPLPPVRHLLSLAKDADFPATRQQIEETANAWGFPLEVTEFLQLFPAGEVFESKVDFMTRCEELEMLINQQRDTPQELLQGPED